MAEPSVDRIRPGAAVFCTDGRIGTVTRIEPGPDRAAAFVRVALETDDLDLLVPLDLVSDLADNGSVLLDCASSDLVAADSAGGSSAAPRGGHQTVRDAASGTGGTIELREEQLIPRRQLREAGHVRIRKAVEEVPRELEVEAFREQVAVEHVPVGQVVSEKVAPWREGEFLIVPVYEEQVEVVKRLVLREQLKIRLESATETRRFVETVRRERVEIDDATNQGFVSERQSAAEPMQASNDPAGASGRPAPEVGPPARPGGGERARRPGT